MSAFHFLNKTQPESVTSLNLPDNTSCVLLKKRTISVEAMPMPILQPDGVLVKVISTGICGSDMHNYLSGGVGGRPAAIRLVMCHESSGEVIAVGELVDSHKVGDRVAGMYIMTYVHRFDNITVVERRLVTAGLPNSRARTPLSPLRQLQKRSVPPLYRYALLWRSRLSWLTVSVSDLSFTFERHASLSYQSSIWIWS